ncbi:MAG TPA: DUF4266 domain-containing protein [Casimicrobiaceae bacterium]|nr:DUF4266 domain-containing protein [Casimicrobiaceae bacterium]
MRSAIAGCVAVALCGCASYAPPQAWEKQYLAKPAMQFDAHRLDVKNVQHVYVSKEGSAGGYGVGGGGCGCN